MEIKPITLRQASDFINEKHRHHKATVGHKFSIGLFDGNRMVGCAVCGRPVGRYLDDGLTCEINRLCTDGTKNACSMLYGACCRVAKEMGYHKIITYILAVSYTHLDVYKRQGLQRCISRRRIKAIRRLNAT